MKIFVKTFSGKPILNDKPGLEETLETCENIVDLLSNSSESADIEQIIFIADSVIENSISNVLIFKKVDDVDGVFKYHALTPRYQQKVPVMNLLKKVKTKFIFEDSYIQRMVSNPNSFKELPIIGSKNPKVVLDIIKEGIDICIETITDGGMKKDAIADCVELISEQFSLENDSETNYILEYFFIRTYEAMKNNAWEGFAEETPVVKQQKKLESSELVVSELSEILNNSQGMIDILNNLFNTNVKSCIGAKELIFNSDWEGFLGFMLDKFRFLIGHGIIQISEEAQMEYFSFPKENRYLIVDELETNKVAHQYFDYISSNINKQF